MVVKFIMVQKVTLMFALIFVASIYNIKAKGLV